MLKVQAIQIQIQIQIGKEGLSNLFNKVQKKRKFSERGSE